MNQMIIVDTSAIYYKVVTTLTRVDQIKDAFFNKLEEILTQAQIQCRALYFTLDQYDNNTFRHRLYSEYKAQRPQRSELEKSCKRLLHAILKSNYNAVYKSGVESDDLIASLVNKYKHQVAKIYILTGDKDLFQLATADGQVVMIYNSEQKDYSQIVLEETLLPEEIAYFKAIAGDRSDNITGITGIGKQGAFEILDSLDIETLNKDLIIGSNIKEKNKKKLIEELDRFKLFLSLTKLNVLEV